MPPKGTRKKNPVTQCRWGHTYDEANTRMAPGNRRQCRACDRIRSERSRAEDPVLFKRKALERTMRWKANHPERSRTADRNQMLRKYRLTPQDYDNMLLAQSGVCAICLRTCGTGRRLAVDHDADTGQVRGLLCANCNRAIGLLRHRTDDLLRAIEYLTKTVTLT